MRRRGFLAALFTLPFVRRFRPAWTLYDSTPLRSPVGGQAIFRGDLVAINEKGKLVPVKRYHSWVWAGGTKYVDGQPVT